MEDERILTNPAQANRAQSELPEDIGESEQQQFWSPEDRVRLLRFVDRRASDAIDEQGFDATTEVRDRAIVYLLAYSGCRIGEIVRDPSLTPPPPLDGRETPTRERAGTMGFDGEFRTTIVPQTLP